MRILMLTFLSISAFSLIAQGNIDPCARVLLGSGMDSISWNATPCTGFGGYVVLQQQNGTGSFISVDTVLSANAAVSNPGEQINNYQIAMLCNGALTNLSIVVSNQRPITPNIRSVSFVSGKPFIEWNSSPSPEVNAYQLYKEQPYNSGNYFPYPSNGSVVTGNSYLDVGAVDLLNRYAIVAISDCNKSLLGIGDPIDGTTGPHTSIVLESELDSCDASLSLQWNDYENWKDGVDGYEVYVNANGTGEVLVGSTSATNYQLQNLTDGDQLLIKIKALEQNSNVEAITNELNVQVVANKKMDYIHLVKASNLFNDNVELEWHWDTEVDFNLAVINDTSSNGSQQLISLSSLGQNPNLMDLPLVKKGSAYQIQSLDNCEQRFYSNQIQPVWIEALNVGDFQNKISWDRPKYDNGLVQSMNLFKVRKNGSTQIIASLDSTVTEFLDVLDVENANESQVCYYLSVNVLFDFGNNQKYFTENHSNQSCVVQQSIMHLPNALAPEGENKFFKPLIVFMQNISEYEMSIFDRYGQLLFQTNDMLQGWDGSAQGQALKAGMYVYQIRFKQLDGTTEYKKGTVMLVR